MKKIILSCIAISSTFIALPDPHVIFQANQPVVPAETPPSEQYNHNVTQKENITPSKKLSRRQARRKRIRRNRAKKPSRLTRFLKKFFLFLGITILTLGVLAVTSLLGVYISTVCVAHMADGSVIILPLLLPFAIGM